MSERLNHNLNRKPKPRGLSPLQMKQRIRELEEALAEIADVARTFRPSKATLRRILNQAADALGEEKLAE